MDTANGLGCSATLSVSPTCDEQQLITYYIGLLHACLHVGPMEGSWQLPAMTNELDQDSSIYVGIGEARLESKGKYDSKKRYVDTRRA